MASMKLLKLGVLIIILFAGGVGTANSLCTFHFHLHYYSFGAQAATLGVYDKDGVGWKVTKNIPRGELVGSFGFSVSNKMCMYPCRITFQRKKAGGIFVIVGLSLTVSETFTEPQFVGDDDSIKINTCNEIQTTGGSSSGISANDRHLWCDLDFQIDYVTSLARGKPLSAEFVAADNNGSSWTAGRKLSRDTTHAKNGFIATNERCIYPCLLGFRREKVEANENFNLTTLRIAVSQIFPRRIDTVGKRLVEIKNCNKTRRGLTN